MDIYLILYLVFVVGPLSTIIHEAGHAFAARTAKADHIVLSIGFGKKLYEKTFTILQLSIHRFFFLGGFATSYRNKQFTHSELIWITIMGPLTSAFLALAAFFIYGLFPNNYLFLFYLFNTWLAIVNLLPIKFRGKQSDGYKILQIIKHRH